jgi:hypothetical protein
MNSGGTKFEFLVGNTSNYLFYTVFLSVSSEMAVKTICFFSQATINLRLDAV